MFHVARAGDLACIDATGDVEAWVSSQLEFMRTDAAREFERPMRDGRVLLVRTRPAGEGGYVAISTDVTALKRAEKRLIDAVESMSDAFVLWNEEDRLVLCNTAYAAMF